MQKFGAYLENVATEASVVIIGYLMRLVLIYNEKIVVVYVVDLTADKEAFTPRNAEKDLTAIVDMYIGIRIALLGIIYAKA